MKENIKAPLFDLPDKGRKQIRITKRLPLAKRVKRVEQQTKPLRYLWCCYVCGRMRGLTFIHIAGGKVALCRKHYREPSCENRKCI